MAALLILRETVEAVETSVLFGNLIEYYSKFIESSDIEHTNVFIGTMSIYS